jgi:hypothetical protein
MELNQMFNQVFCSGCENMIEIKNDSHPFHNDCEEYAYVCGECGTLNVDYESTQLLENKI